MAKVTIASLQAQIAELEAKLAARSTQNRVRRSTYVAPAPTAEQVARRAAMAAACEEAMRTGRVVHALS